MPWKQAKKPVTPSADRNAATLRKILTEPEKRLWRLLRQRLPVDGSHFRRQVALGAYVADFCCFSPRLIIEVDGDQHGTDKAAIYDDKRSAYLLEQGFAVLRFSNRQVMVESEMVIDTIYAVLSGRLALQGDALATTPTPNPSPQGGGGYPTPDLNRTYGV